ncbi:3807_t:CDS:10 [Funneliformis mosseae]|uniref:3807_t:CDS:1 n=1 Tax=Funneliformis mosseae TaxID=27381 RepID=A0A9N9N6N7_FUNMO|nr:3807_t:CDS:10 [Funneliformis mosseae]
MSTSTIIATENLAEEMESWGLHHATYWSRNPSSWGCLSDWDVQFIEETPGCTRDESHRNLGIELNILLNKFPSTSRQYSKANALKKALGNSDGDSANILLWEKHLEELKSMAISDRVHRVCIVFDLTKQEIGRAEEQISEKSKKRKASTKGSEISLSSFSNNNEEENYNKQENDAIASDSVDDFHEVAESMIGKVERTALMADDVNLEEIFEGYCNECENIFDLCYSDIMDLRPASKFSEKIPEVIWEKFVTNTYPEHEISESWEKLIQEIFKPKETFAGWMEVWRGLYTYESNRDPTILLIKDAIHNILTPYIEAFKAPYNLLKSGSLGENQYNSQFVSPILSNTLKVILDVNWRILEVPVESSKHRRNAKINPIIDTVLEAKRADGLACFWKSNEEVFIYEQTGPPDFDDVTQIAIHDYKLVRTMRDVLNQRIMLRLRDGISDNKNLASFGAFGHRTEVSLFWCTMHQKSYCLQEFGSFKVPTIWQELPVLAEAIITCLKFFFFMKENVKEVRLYTDQKNKLFVKRKVHAVKQNPPSPSRPKKRKNKKN